MSISTREILRSCVSDLAFRFDLSQNQRLGLLSIRMIRVLTWFRRVLAVEFDLCCALRWGAASVLALQVPTGARLFLKNQAQHG
jgi:hypothetical protein